MTANDDIERAPANETTALLHQESGPNYKADTTPPELAQQDGQPVTSVETKWNRVGLIWRAVAVASGVVLLVLAVQGWRNVDKGFDWAGSFKKALGGGLSGAAAMVLQVLVLMPLRTVMNYQYRYGTSTKAATLTLWYDGGFGRYYQGLGAALIQGPAARFGDTFANALVLALLHSNETLKNIPIFLQTALASISAAAFRVLLTPIDTVKTTLQTEGSRGIGVLKRRMKNDGVKTLWFGALATAAATFVGHYPWFFVYNYLDASLPAPTSLLEKLARQALIGFCASVVSDTASNSLRVIKTYRQVNEVEISYADAARTVIRQEGITGLLGRGLKTRIIANGMQGLLFSILWKLFMDLWDSKTRQ